MKIKIYNFLVNRHAGISKRYHRFHDNSGGIRKIVSWIYLFWLNFAYYVLFCRFLGATEQVEVYEQKKLVIESSESELHKKEHPDDVDTLVNKLTQYDVISFDVFDTLIFRPFSEPTDLFYIIGEKLGFMDFKRIRIESEVKARKVCFKKNGHYEVTLEDIWDILSKDTGIDKEIGMKLEIELEKKLCYANPFMKAVYDRLQKQGKKLVIISDMYLPESVLSDILSQNGYIGMEKIYVSCQYGENKASGSLYRRVIKEQVVSRHNPSWIHIGDNINSDVEQAKRAGVDSYYYPNVNKKTCMLRTYDMSPIVGGAYRGVINNHIYNGIECYSKEYEYGYIYGGLFVLGYCHFIHEYCKKNSVDKVLFLSRDGDILRQVYSYLYPDEASEYIYWSRRAATKLMADSNKYDYYRRFILHKANKCISIERILHGMELDDICNILPDELSKDSLLTDKNAERLKQFIDDHWNFVQDAYAYEHKGAHAYFTEMLDGCKKACAVDIGWAGSGAISINHLVDKVWKMDCEVIGIIAGTNTVHNAEPDASETFLQSGNLVSYLYSMSHNRDLMKKHNPNADYNVYWELLLSSPTPQFKGFSYDDKTEMYELRFGDKDANERGILDIQQGIKDFVKEYHSHFKDFSYMYNISGRDAYAPMLVAASHMERYLKDIEKRFNLEVGIS